MKTVPIAQYQTNYAAGADLYPVTDAQGRLKVSGADLAPNDAAAHVTGTVSSTAVLLTTLFTLHADTNYVIIDVETDAIRYTLSGTTPTSSLGYKVAADTTGLVFSRAQASAMKVIRVTSDATLQIGQFK